MTGEKVKSLIFARGYSVAQVAELIGTSQQNLAASLKHTDIRSGLIERIAEALDIKLSEFYGASFGPDPEVVPSTLEQPSDFVNTTDKLMELLKVKDEQLLESMKQTSTAQDQMTEVLSQMREVIKSIKPQESPLSMQIIQPTSSPVTQTSGYTSVTTRSKRKGPLTSSIAKKLTDKPKF